MKVWTAVCAVTASFVALGGIASATAQAQNTALRGRVAIDGSSTVYPITEAAAAEFRDQYRNVAVNVGVSGTGGGFKRFTRGETAISDASRPIKDKELKAAAANNVRFIELPVALDGLSVVLNPDNDWVDQLTIEDLQKIYLSNNPAQTWKDVNPKWPAVPIKVYSPGTDSGTFDYFKEVVLPEGQSFRSDMSVSEDDNVLVTGVAGDRGAIGYFGAAYYFENKDSLRAAPIVNPKTGEAVLPTPENVEAGTYAPLSRPLFIYVSLDAMRRPEVREFVEFYLDNAGTFAEQVGYAALPQDMQDRAMEFFTKRKTGTTYLTSELEKREGGLREIYQESNLTGLDQAQ